MNRPGRRIALSALIAAALVGGPGASAADDSERLVTDREAKRWNPELRDAYEFALSRTGDVSFAVVDMKGRLGERNGYGAAKMASTAKVMLMAAYLRQNDVEDRSLTRYEKSLVEPMIRRSDNGAATTINNMLGRAPLEELADDAGMNRYQWSAASWGQSKTTTRDQAFFMRNLQQLIPDRHWEYARHQLASITSSQRWGIGEVDLNGWSVAFKGGWGVSSRRASDGSGFRPTARGAGTVNHQVAFLRKGGRRIGLSVLTEGNPTHSYGTATLEGVFERLLEKLPR